MNLDTLRQAVEAAHAAGARVAVHSNLRTRVGELCERLRDCLPYAVAHDVRVLAGTDVVGTIADEIALLADHGLAVEQAIAAVVVRGVRVR